VPALMKKATGIDRASGDIQRPTLPACSCHNLW
jgi:hypothetical protein